MQALDAGLAMLCIGGPFVKIPAHKSLIADDGPHRYTSAAEFHYSFHPSSCETMVWEVPDVLSSSGPATVDIGFVTEPNELKIFDLPITAFLAFQAGCLVFCC